MSAVIMRHARPGFAQESARQLTRDQKADAFDSYFHYSGIWVIENHDLIHSVEFSLNPAFIGTKQRRHAQMSDDRNLLLSAQEKSNVGAIRHHYLEWRR
jgi:hypothetical protein